MFSVAKMLRKNFTEANCVVEEGGSSGLNEDDHSRLTDVSAWHYLKALASMALLKKCVIMAWDFRVHKPMSSPESLFFYCLLIWI